MLPTTRRPCHVMQSWKAPATENLWAHTLTPFSPEGPLHRCIQCSSRTASPHPQGQISHQVQLPHQPPHALLAAMRQPGLQGLEEGGTEQVGLALCNQGTWFPCDCWQQSAGYRTAALFYLITDSMGFLSRSH